mmetsp:Transcript_51311/g.85094  ORF Transcript_51311/g.85094 Transcript_51311/m.85094 type:complete len:98 (+) Transcript_51311:145-438(+)
MHIATPRTHALETLKKIMVFDCGESRDLDGDAFEQKTSGWHALSIFRVKLYTAPSQTRTQRQPANIFPNWRKPCASDQPNLVQKDGITSNITRSMRR